MTWAGVLGVAWALAFLAFFLVAERLLEARRRRG